MAHRPKSNRLGMPLSSADQNQIEETWAELKAAFILIQEQRFSTDRSYQELYRLGYNLAIANQTKLLYNGIKDVVTSHLVIVLEDIRALASEKLLDGVMEAYLNHHESMLRIRDVLLYMDSKRGRDKGQRPVFDLGMALFVTEILYDSEIRDRMSHELQRRIQHMRKIGSCVDEPILKTVTRMLLEVGLALPINHREPYERVVEADYFETASSYYRRFSHGALQLEKNNDCVDYLKAIDIVLNQEMELVRTCLDDDSVKKAHQLVHNELLGAHKDKIIGNLDIRSMMEQQKYADISLLFRMFHPTKGGLGMISSEIATHINTVCSAGLKAEDQADGSGDDTAKETTQDTQQARRANAAKSNPVKLVSSIALLMQQYHTMLLNALSVNNDFHHVINTSFADVINKHDRFPEYISIYIDHLLRSQSKDLVSPGAIPGATAFKDTETAIDYAIKLFRLMTEKDVFERYYKHHLAKRLLLGKATSGDAERTVISLLKAECGHHFTFRFEGMFKDMQSSSDNMQLFLAAHKERFKKTRTKTSASRAPTPGKDDTVPAATASSTSAANTCIPSSNDPSAIATGTKTNQSAVVEKSTAESGDDDMPLIELDVRVLATVMWPTQTPSTCVLPVELQRVADVYKTWYVAKHKGRNLTWQTALGSVVLQAHFTGRPPADPKAATPPADATTPTPCTKTLHLSTQQGVVLLQFDSRAATTTADDARTLTFAQLQTATGLETADLTRALASMCMGKHRVLVRANRATTGPVTADDTFAYNDAFTSKLTKVKISPGVQKETAPERKATRQRVDEDRRLQIEACIVRVMKGRRTMVHNDLVAEVTQQLSSRFAPKPQLIKQRIGRLIENEYLQRDSENANTYNYVA
eukprot:m.25740 g.25740  ORF g.25740 m.25740 type:complete len:872 (+) comp13219_c1_seq1:203-2818(+)